MRPRESRMVYAPPRNSDPLTSSDWPSHPQQNPGNANFDSYDLQEFLALCEEVDTDPWVCVPGILKPAEMFDLMEYLNGPTTTPYGKLRAERGHPKPWTQVFKNIYIEFGNEAWNYAGAYWRRGYNGRDYWRYLIGAGKMAPYYNPIVKFEIAGQASGPGTNANIAADKWNADGFAVAPYMIHEMSAVQAKQSDELIWSWVFGYPWYNGTQGYMAQNYHDVSKKLGLELSIYEVNHHITGGDAPADARNKIVAGIGGGINVANWMMSMVERQNVRTQNLFSLLQFEYQKVRLWGTALSMQPGSERYRPTFLSVSMLNQVLFGDLVTAKKSGADPTWNCTADYGSKNIPFDVPYIQAYATRKDEQHGFIVFNFSRTDTLPVVLNFPGKVLPGSVTKWTLQADTIDANNEPEHAPQVKVMEENLADFASGQTLSLKPFSMVVIRWEEPRDRNVAQFTATANPSGHWSYLAATYGDGTNSSPRGFDLLASPPVKMIYDTALAAWKSPTSEGTRITADGRLYHSGLANSLKVQNAPILRYTYSGAENNPLHVQLTVQWLGREIKDVLVLKNQRQTVLQIPANEDYTIIGAHTVGSPESKVTIQGAPYDTTIKQISSDFDVSLNNGDTLDFMYTGLWDPHWELPRLQVVVNTDVH